jgi:hypothetical protein
MLLESIKEIKNGRIVIRDAPPIIEEDTYKGKHYKIWSEGLTYFGKVDGIADYFSASNIIQLKKNIKEVISETKDSQYTKAEYQLKILSLTNKLQKAKQLGDSEEAKEIQKKIDELKALESGVQDTATFEQNYKGIKIYSEPNYSGGKKFYWVHPKTGQNINWNTLMDVKEDIDRHKDLGYLDSDTEAKITDLTEKVKQARAQGYAADQYEVEIEKLKAKDKKTKDTPRDNIERQIDKLEDQLEKATGAEKVRIQAEIDNLEEDLEYNQDSKDILTQDPNK